MKAVRFHEHGGPEVLRYEDVPDPVPGAGEVLIKVEAAAVNYADTIRRLNDPYPEPSPPPFTLGVEVAGTVAALGDGVSGPAVGTRVLAAPGRGGYAQYVVVPAPLAIPIPPSLDAARAASLTLVGLTAALSLRLGARLATGESILVQAAAGGVGSLAVQLARRAGAGRIVAAASTEEKRRFAVKLGADVAVDYTREGWSDEVRRVTDGKGVDVVLEMTGGQVFHESHAALAPFGRLVNYGLASREAVSLNPMGLAIANQSLVGFYVGSYLDRPELIGSTMAELVRLVADDALCIHVGTTFPLRRAADAHRLIESRRSQGKIVLLPWSD